MKPQFCECRSLCARHLTLDATQVHQVEVAGQDGLQRRKSLQGGDATSFGQHGERQDLMVQVGAGHVTEY